MIDRVGVRQGDQEVARGRRRQRHRLRSHAEFRRHRVDRDARGRRARGISDVDLLEAERRSQSSRERKADLCRGGLNAGDVKAGVDHSDLGVDQSAARDRDLFSFTSDYRRRTDRRDRRRLRGSACNDLQDIAGGVIDILRDAALLVDHAYETT